MTVGHPSLETSTFLMFMDPVQKKKFFCCNLDSPHCLTISPKTFQEKLGGAIVVLPVLEGPRARRPVMLLAPRDVVFVGGSGWLSFRIENYSALPNVAGCCRSLH